MNEDVTPQDIVEYAIHQRISLTKAIEVIHKGPNNERRNLWRRVQKYVKSTPGGEALFSLLLRHGANYDLYVASRLACESDDALSVVLDGGMPLVDICEDHPNSRQLYHTLYNRALRDYPDRIDGLRKKPHRGRSGSVFHIKDHEFGEVRR